MSNGTMATTFWLLPQELHSATSANFLPQITEHTVRKVGIEVIAIPGGGLGVAVVARRCMSCPVERVIA